MTRSEWVVCVWFVGLALYSVYALLFLPPSQHVSNIVYRWCRANPILAFALGVLVGHWLWPPSPGGD